MQSDRTAKQVARWTALVALFLLPLTPLVVVDSFFFPFITGKAFYLRILIEVAFVAWVVLALLDKEYRPRFSWIGAAVVGLVAWMFIADAFAPNALKAFWSNFERMEGWVLLIHLLGLFFAASAVLRVERAWRAWFLTSLGVAVAISVYALIQLSGGLPIHQGSVRIDASLGNSAYLAIYLLFTVFVALWLALTEKYSWLKWSLIALAVVDSVLIFFTETRGTIIGLVLALALAALLAVLTADKNTRRYAAGALAAILLLSGGFYLARDSEFIRNNDVLGRIASISLSDGATRFTIWSMALRGVAERPLTGYGQEGFNYIFNKYYEPSLYHQEPWFDRAHSAFIDWLTAGGIPAFLLYIALFGAALMLLWRSSEPRRQESGLRPPASELSRPERIALTAALVGYAVHNIFVFDNLYSYIYFFAILALIDSQVARPIERFERAPELSAENGVIYALPVAAVAAIALVWYVNIPGMRVASNLIKAITPSNAGVEENIAVFEGLAARPSFAAQEVREQLVSFANSVAQSTQVSDANKQKIVLLAIAEMQKQVSAYPFDARERLQLAYAYRAAGDAVSALAQFKAAVELSPRKEQMLIETGVAEWDANDTKAAQTYFNAAYELGPQFTDLAVYAAAGKIAAGDVAAGDTILLDNFGTTNVDSNVLAVAYYNAKNWPRLIRLLQSRTQDSGADASRWFSLAAAYYTSGDKASAIQTIKAAVAKFPDAAASGAAAIQQIEAGK